MDPAQPSSPPAGGDSAAADADQPAPPRPKPVLRVGGDPNPTIAADGTPVMRYPFELRAKGNSVRLHASVQVMTNDGESIESEPPRGWVAPSVRAWIDPAGVEHHRTTLDRAPESADGAWIVEIPIAEDAVIGVDISTEVIP